MPRQSWKVANPRLVCKENVNYPLNVKKELEMIAEALIDGSRFSGTKSVEVETPALKAAADDERFVLVGEMYAGVFPHVAKMLDLELTRYPTNSNPYTANIWATEYEEDCKAYFCLGDQGKSGKQFRTNIGDPGSLFWAFLLPSRPGQPSVVHVVNELNYGIKRDEEQHPVLFNAMRRAWRCQGHEKITQSVVDRILAAATAANQEKIVLFLPPRRLEAAEDFAGTVLHMVRAVFEQLGHTLISYSQPVMKLSGLGDGIFDYVFIEDEGHGRVSVHVRWMDCGLYCDERRADRKPCDFFHTFPRGGSIPLERLLPTGRLEIAFQQIRPWGGRGTASAEAAKMNCLLRKCAACSISETVAGQRLSCCKRCKDQGVIVWYCCRECQVSHFPEHKRVCGGRAGCATPSLPGAAANGSDRS